MRYYEAFTSKYGFADGEAVPPDADAHREALVRLFNRRAMATGSRVRCLAYNRPGVHNPCLVLFAKSSAIKAIHPEHLHDHGIMSQWVDDTDGIESLLIQPDDKAVATIVGWLDDHLELDALVWTDVSFDIDTLERVLKQAGRTRRKGGAR